MSALLLGLALNYLVTPAALAARPAGSVTILDARAPREYRQGHVPGAVPIDWTDYRDGWGRTGRLPADLDALARRLSALGIDERRPVAVYGKTREGWGEEGRIVWMLAFLGHPDVGLLDGGWSAWRDAGLPTSTAAEKALPGQFAAHPIAAFRVDADDVERLAARGGALLDVRSASEWRGATPHFEHRGGHIPGAVHLEWTELLDGRGRLDATAARARLHAAGVDPARPVITYCTAGVRAAEAWVILRALGYADVRVYDGSWYEWSADEARPVAMP